MSAVKGNAGLKVGVLLLIIGVVGLVALFTTSSPSSSFPFFSAPSGALTRAGCTGDFYVDQWTTYVQQDGWTEVDLVSRLDRDEIIHIHVTETNGKVRTLDETFVLPAGAKESFAFYAGDHIDQITFQSEQCKKNDFFRVSPNG